MPSHFESIALAVLVAVTFGLCVAISTQIGEHDERYYAGRSRADQELAPNSVASRLNRRPAADGSICREKQDRERIRALPYVA